MNMQFYFVQPILSSPASPTEENWKLIPTTAVGSNVSPAKADTGINTVEKP